MKYMPDPTPDGRLPDRNYFWNVLNTVQTTYVRNVIQHANEQRMSAKADTQNEEVIDVTEGWWDKLMANPFVSCKCMSNSLY